MAAQPQSIQGLCYEAFPLVSPMPSNHQEQQQLFCQTTYYFFGTKKQKTTYYFFCTKKQSVKKKTRCYVHSHATRIDSELKHKVNTCLSGNQLQSAKVRGGCRVGKTW